MPIRNKIYGFSHFSGQGSSDIRRRRRGLMILAIFLLLAHISAEAQCSMCRAVVESEADGTIAEGINNGILYLMAIPYLIVGAIFFFVYRKLRKAN